MALLALNSVRHSRYFLRVLTQSRFASNDQAQSLKPFSDIPGKLLVQMQLILFYTLIIRTCIHMHVGPKGLPLVGSLFDVMRNLSKAGDEAYFHQLLLKYGPVVKVTTMGESTII